MDSYRYSKVTLDRARAIYGLLSKRVRAGNTATITYGEVAKALGFHVRAIKFPLAKIQDECRAAGKPTLTVLVVDARTRMPNAGCDAFGERAVSVEMEAIKGTEWPVHAWW